MVDRSAPAFRAALELYEHAPLLELGRLADEARWRLHREPQVTYIIDRNINYTNVCIADCKFCAFYRRPKHPEGYVLSYEEIGSAAMLSRAVAGLARGKVIFSLPGSSKAVRLGIESLILPQAAHLYYELHKHDG